MVKVVVVKVVVVLVVVVQWGGGYDYNVAMQHTIKTETFEIKLMYVSYQGYL